MARRRRTADEASAILTLAAGGTITLAFQGNLFNLTTEEQKLIADLTGIIREYDATRIAGEPTAAATVKPETARRRQVRELARNTAQSRKDPLQANGGVAAAE
jgi:DNA replication initiation complex subunit (GINS family)